MTLELLKQYLRISGDYDDDIILMLKGVAEAFVDGALDNPSLVKDDKRYGFAVALLVTHYYDNREILVNGGLVEAPYGVLSLIQQLRGVAASG